MLGLNRGQTGPSVLSASQTNLVRWDTTVGQCIFKTTESWFQSKTKQSKASKTKRANKETNRETKNNQPKKVNFFCFDPNFRTLIQNKRS